MFFSFSIFCYGNDQCHTYIWLCYVHIACFPQLIVNTFYAPFIDFAVVEQLFKKANMIKQPQAAHVVISMFSIPSFWRKKSMQIIGLLIERKRTQRSHRGVYLFWGHLDIKIANNLKVMEEAWHFDFFGSAEAKLTQTPTKFKLFRTVASLLNKISV